MPVHLMWILMMTLVSAQASGATMNKCVHANGRIEFTDSTCPSGATEIPDKSKEPVRHIQLHRNGIDSISSVTLLAGSKEQSGATDGTGATARFNNPGGIASDGKHLYIVDTGNQTIRKLELTTGKVSTLAGRTSKRGHKDGIGEEARFNIPQGIAIDRGNLYVTDVASYCIRKIAISTGEVTTFAGNPGTSGTTDGVGREATFNYPLGITAVGGNLYVTEKSNSTIRKIEIATGRVSTIAGRTVLVELDASAVSHLLIKSSGQKVLSHVSGNVDGIGQDARFGSPAGITNDGKNLYVSDNYNQNIRKINIATGEVTTLAGPNEANCAAGYKRKCPLGLVDGQASEARFSYPEYLASDGINLYISEHSNNTIRKVSLATGEVQTLISQQAGSTRSKEIAHQLQTLWGLAISNDSGLIIADRLGNSIYRLH